MPSVNAPLVALRRQLPLAQGSLICYQKTLSCLHYPNKEINLAQGSLTCYKRESHNINTTGHKTLLIRKTYLLDQNSPLSTLNFQLNNSPFSILNSQFKQTYLLDQNSPFSIFHFPFSIFHFPLSTLNSQLNNSPFSIQANLPANRLIKRLRNKSRFICKDSRLKKCVKNVTMVLYKHRGGL